MFYSDQYQSDEGYFRVLAYIVDDEEIREVKFLFTDSKLVGNLYDDGLHFDGEPQDNIFGNQFPKPDLGYLTSYLVDMNKLIIPISNDGLLADVDFRDTFH